jgi:rhodanese-related sulfurtransferase
VPSPDTITVAQLSRLIGTPDAPAIIDVRIAEDRASDPRVIPSSIHRDARAVPDWATDWATDRTVGWAGRSVVVACRQGRKLSQGAAAWLRQSGVNAQTLEGGFEAWVQAQALLVNPKHVPPHDAKGRTVWVTRARPKIDRIACPWLIRRFINPSAVFLFVAPSEVQAVAERFGATPFDVDGIFWSHRGETCTFEAMLEEFGLHSPALDRLAAIVRGADTDRLDAAPEAAGLLAASLGLSRMFRDDLAQLDAAMVLYDAFYRWARDATTETHNWPATPGARA